MEPFTKRYNKQQKELRNLLLNDDRHREAINLFLSHHALLHSAKVLQDEPMMGEIYSLEDELLDDMTEGQIRRIPQKCEHSVAWEIWHIARIEDVTMNLLVADRSQIAIKGQWLPQMNIDIPHTGNAMSEAAIADLSATIDIEALRAYRLAVGRGTQEIVTQLQPEQLRAKVDLLRLEKVVDQGAVVEEARGIIDYWSKRSIAGLLLMPATRHNLVHLNEALRLKRRRS